MFANKLNWKQQITIYSKHVSAKITKTTEGIENEQPSANESFFPADKQEKPVTQLAWIPRQPCALSKYFMYT